MSGKPGAGPDKGTARQSEGPRSFLGLPGLPEAKYRFDLASIKPAVLKGTVGKNRAYIFHCWTKFEWEPVEDLRPDPTGWIAQATAPAVVQPVGSDRSRQAAGAIYKGTYDKPS
jgi:hypothetical protein